MRIQLLSSCPRSQILRIYTSRFIFHCIKSCQMNDHNSIKDPPFQSIYLSACIITISNIFLTSFFHFDRFDIVPGVVSKYVTLPGMTSQKSLCCIGDEELVIGGRDGGVFLIPTSPSIMPPTTITISDCQVHIPGRVVLEARVKAMIATNVAAVLDKDEVRILSRTLKIGKLTVYYLAQHL